MLGVITLGLAVLLVGVMIGWIFVDKLNQCLDELVARGEVAFERGYDIVIRSSYKNHVEYYTVWLKSKKGRDWFLSKMPAAGIKKNLGGTYSVVAKVYEEVAANEEDYPSVIHYCY